MKKSAKTFFLVGHFFRLQAIKLTDKIGSGESSKLRIGYGLNEVSHWLSNTLAELTYAMQGVRIAKKFEVVLLFLVVMLFRPFQTSWKQIDVHIGA